MPKPQWIQITSEDAARGSSFVAFLWSTGKEDNEERVGDDNWSTKSQISLNNIAYISKGVPR